MADIDEESALLEGEGGRDLRHRRENVREATATAPVIMGHENAGVISRAGRRFAERKGVVTERRANAESS